MRARLYSPVGTLQLDHTFESEATLGRSPDNTVVLSQELLSAHHLKVVWSTELGAYELEDLGSSNGTRLDGARVRGSQRLGHLHVITLAERFPLVFQDLEACAARHGRPTHPGARPLPVDKTLAEPLPLPLPAILQRATGGGGKGDDDEIPMSEKTLFEKLPLPMPAFLRRKAGEEEKPPRRVPETRTEVATERRREPRPPMPTVPADAGLRLPGSPILGDSEAPEKSFDPATGLLLEVAEEQGARYYPLRPGKQSLGRGMEVELRILSPQVSRTHATFTVEGGRILLHDQGSSNHTFVEGRRVDHEVEVRPGQRIAFGVLEARILHRDGDHPAADVSPQQPQGEQQR